MPRRARVAPGGLVYHVLNRWVAGLPLFRKKQDYEAFERIMIEAHQRHPTRLLAWCVIGRPRNWVRLVNEPVTDKEVEGVRTCIARNRPFGSEAWQKQQAKRLGLLHTLRREGRPKAINRKN